MNQARLVLVKQLLFKLIDLAFNLLDWYLDCVGSEELNIVLDYISPHMKSSFKYYDFSFLISLTALCPLSPSSHKYLKRSQCLFMTTKVSFHHPCHVYCKYYQMLPTVFDIIFNRINMIQIITNMEPIYLGCKHYSTLSAY